MILQEVQHKYNNNRMIVVKMEPPSAPPYIGSPIIIERKDLAEISIRNKERKKSTGEDCSSITSATSSTTSIYSLDSSNDIDILDDSKESSGSTTTISSKNRKKKNVSFYSGSGCAVSRVIETLHHKDYTSFERRKCWYKRSDFKLWKKQFQPTVELMKKGIISPAEERDGHCYRGLENRIAERALERRALRNEGKRLVFEKQLQLQQQHRRRKRMGRVKCRNNNDTTNSLLKNNINSNIIHNMDDDSSSSDSDSNDNNNSQELLIVGASDETVPMEYKFLTQFCVLRAHDIGLCDEREASVVIKKSWGREQKYNYNHVFKRE